MDEEMALKETEIELAQLVIADLRVGNSKL
jgi:hypothetical protein